MLLGDGINRTVITGNRSVVDGWTTFNSATFGEWLNFHGLITFGGSFSKWIYQLVYLILITYIWCSCIWREICSHRHNIQEHSRSREAPSGSREEQCWSLHLLPLQLWRISRHTLCTFSKAILQGLHRIWNCRFHLWELCLHLSELQLVCSKAHAQSEKRLHSPGADGSKSEHWHLHSQLHHWSCPWLSHGLELHLELSGSSMEAVLQDCVHAVVYWQPHRSSGMAGMEWNSGIGHPLLWRVRELWARCKY